MSLCLENNLSRQIGALKDLKKELGVRRNSLVKAMIAEVEREVYEDLHSRPHAEAATATSSHHFDRQSSMLSFRLELGCSCTNNISKYQPDFC